MRMSEVVPDGKKEATRVVYDYDEQNRVVARTDVTTPATPLDTRFGYDQQGNMTSQTDPDGDTTRFEYDVHAAGRRSSYVTARIRLTIYPNNPPTTADKGEPISRMTQLRARGISSTCVNRTSRPLN
jgi:YD repeat-containing protein